MGNDSEYSLLLLTLSITFVGALISVAEKWIPEASIKKKRIISTVAAGFVVLGAVFSFIIGVELLKQKKKSEFDAVAEKIENNKLRDSLLRMSSAQINILNKNVELSQQVNQEQKSLFDFERKSFEQLTGGENRPIITITHKVGQFYATDLKEIYSKIYLNNVGNTYLKNVEVFIDDIVKESDLLNKEWLGPSEYRRVHGSYGAKMRRAGEYLIKKDIEGGHTVYKNLNTLTPNAQKDIYTPTINERDSTIRCNIHVIWTSGSYIVNIQARFYNGFLYFKNIDYSENGSRVNEYSFFSVKRVPLPKQIKLCKPIIYNKESYNVYWDENKHTVSIKKPESINFFELYGVIANDKETAREKALSKMNEIFNNTEEYYRFKD